MYNGMFVCRAHFRAVFALRRFCVSMREMNNTRTLWEHRCLLGLYMGLLYAHPSV
jgi:hypothetical protein